MLAMYQHLLGKRVRVSTTATSEQGSPHRGEYGEIVYFAQDPDSGEIRSFSVRLQSGETIDLAPAEVDMLD
jgi:hypothetical protein